MVAYRLQAAPSEPAMTAYIALLRAVNVGGTGTLPMADLKAMCEAAGFAEVRTWIASGNVVFESAKPEQAVKTTLEAALAACAGKPVGVLVRTAAEMADVLAANPFPDAAPARTVVLFLDGPPPADTIERVSGRNREAVALGRREIYVDYRDGIGTSKLKIPAAKAATGRNLNTVARLAAMAAAIAEG
jgi:uncharacterized protein (DUF1697 family)